MGAEVAPARHAVTAATTDHMALAGDDLAGAKIIHVGADLDDFTDELVTDHHGDRDGFPGPGIPVEDMHVRTTDGGAL